MDIIDNEYIEEKPVFNLFRPIALLLEWPLVVLTFLGIVIGNEEVKTFAVLTLSGIYLLGAWYLFKAEKFKVIDILVASISGLGLSVVLIGLLFQIQNWPYAQEMVITGLLTLYVCIPLSLILAVIRTTNTSDYIYELRGSLKLLSRLVFLLLMHYALGVGDLLLDLVAR